MTELHSRGLAATTIIRDSALAKRDLLKGRIGGEYREQLDVVGVSDGWVRLSFRVVRVEVRDVRQPHGEIAQSVRSRRPNFGNR